MHDPPPPVLPPKPGSHDTSRIGTPIMLNSPRHGNGNGTGPDVESAGGSRLNQVSQPAGLEIARPESVPDPGEHWLPKVLQDKAYVPGHGSGITCRLLSFSRLMVVLENMTSLT